MQDCKIRFITMLNMSLLHICNKGNVYNVLNYAAVILTNIEQSAL